MHPFSRSRWHLRLLGGGSLLGLVAAQLLLGGRLGRALRVADGRGALDGGLTEIGAVAVLGDLVGNGLVGPVRSMFSMLLAPPCFSLPPFRSPGVVAGSRGYSLAVALATVEDGLGNQLAGVLGSGGLLGQDLDATLLGRSDTDGLFVVRSIFVARREKGGPRAARGRNLSYLVVDEAGMLQVQLVVGIPVNSAGRTRGGFLPCGCAGSSGSGGRARSGRHRPPCG
jgi:hypothetical protein